MNIANNLTKNQIEFILDTVKLSTPNEQAIISKLEAILDNPFIVYSDDEFEETTLDEYNCINADGFEVANTYYEMTEAVEGFKAHLKRVNRLIYPLTITNRTGNKTIIKE